MPPGKEPIILTEDVANIYGDRLMQAGMAVTRKTLAAMPAPPKAKQGYFKDTPFFKDFHSLIEEDEYRIPLENRQIVDRIVRLVGEISFSSAVARELVELRKKSAVVYHHVLATTLLTCRCMLEVNKKDEDTILVARANLVKDLGMARLPRELLKNRDHLTRSEFALIRRHPAEGMVLAYHYFGEGLESMVSLRHHERRGTGYPRIAADKPNQVVDLITAVDIYNALVSPRSFRRESFNVRGAIDEIKTMAEKGAVASWAPRLLANIYRETPAEKLQDVSLSDKKLGYVPGDNFYGLADG